MKILPRSATSVSSRTHIRLARTLPPFEQGLRAVYQENWRRYHHCFCPFAVEAVTTAA
jgi:hypothetical protein